jgi:hypothetical protein
MQPVLHASHHTVAAAFPCVWLLLPLLVPLTSCATCYYKSKLRHSLTIITDQEIIVTAQNFSVCCACYPSPYECCIILLAHITGVTVDTVDNHSCACCAVGEVLIDFLGLLMQQRLIVPEPKQILRLIQDLRRDAPYSSSSSSSTVAVVLTQPTSAV